MGARKTSEALRNLNDFLNAFTGVAAGRIFLEGEVNENPAGVPWLHQKTIWAKPRQIGQFVAGTYREQGLYQVLVYSPQTSGFLAGTDIADALLVYFARGVQLTGNGVTVNIEQSYKSTALAKPDWSIIPVSAEFWYYVPN